ncbi:MAG: flagellar assembly peptidoglycan hydrolase FlgJ [Nitrosospira sp.]|nr:flagellar assembly peptidoglycan hydrolase FlgJ [Nitrosospira sp.]
MVAPADLSTKFALDVQAVNELRVTANRTGQDGLEAAAKQFEALFLNMILKSMRDATPKDSLMDSEQSRFYLSMLDQQLSQSMAARGVGLAEVMMRQLRHAAPSDMAQKADATVAYAAPPQWRAPDIPLPPARQSSLSGNVRPIEQTERPEPNAFHPAPHLQAQPSHVVEFQARLMSYAQEASQATGIPARFMLGQAALESGWGKRELRGADGLPSHNLFGIKAGGNWKGPVVEAVTTEYINGVAHKTVEKFRAYHSYADAFRDYANLLRSNPRYAEVLTQAANGLDAEGFAHGLQRAGYATDPSYAEKLNRIIRTTPWS